PDGDGRRRWCWVTGGLVPAWPLRSERPAGPCQPSGGEADAAQSGAPWHAPRGGNSPGGPAGERMIRILLVDDHAVVRTGFRLLLQARPDVAVVGEADSGEAACQRYIELSPDVVVMDIAM